MIVPYLCLHVSFLIVAGGCHDCLLSLAPTRRLKSVELTFGRKRIILRLLILARPSQRVRECHGSPHLQILTRKQENASIIHARPSQPGRKGVLQLAELSGFSSTSGLYLSYLFSCPRFSALSSRLSKEHNVIFISSSPGSVSTIFCYSNQCF